MRNYTLTIAAMALVCTGGMTAMPTWSQSLSQGLSQGQQPSRQQIEAFCANWGQLSGSEKRQYRAQYERYCRDEPVFGRPVAPQQEQQPQQQQPQKPEKPQKPAAPEGPEQPEPAEPEPQIQPAKPEPVIPEPEPLRVDLVGELALAGPLARQPGERQRLRVTVANRGSDSAPGNQLWARVFLSERQVSRRGASAFAFSGSRRGRPVRLPGVPGSGRSREATTEVTLPAGTPDGNYWWCVRVDTRQQVEETDEDNNTVCARKVVAIGGESDSELSAAFGSKVDDLGQRDDIFGGTAQQDIPPVGEPHPLPEGAHTLEDDDDTLPPPVVRDLEILRVTPLAWHDLVPYPNGLFGQPYLVDVRVRNNGSEPERFHPYFLFEGEERARIGVFAGLGGLGGGESGIEIDPGETKRTRMFIDFRREALPEAYIEDLESGSPGDAPRSVDIPLTIFLGKVDAPGNTLDERVFKDANIGNHVFYPVNVTVINPGSEAPLVKLDPEKTGAELVQKHYSFEGVACGIDRSGLAPTRYWSALEQPVGHFKTYTGNRRRCRSGGSESLVSLVQFDTEAMRPPPGWVVRTAVLRFDVRDPGIHRNNRCETSAAEYIARLEADWLAGKHVVDTHGIFTLGLFTSGGIKELRGIAGVHGNVVYITDWVRKWASGDRSNYGIAFLGKNFTNALDSGNDICVTSLGGLELYISFEPE